jgi:hypothetical protein
MDLPGPGPRFRRERAPDRHKGSRLIELRGTECHNREVRCNDPPLLVRFPSPIFLAENLGGDNSRSLRRAALLDPALRERRCGTSRVRRPPGSWRVNNRLLGECRAQTDCPTWAFHGDTGGSDVETQSVRYKLGGLPRYNGPLQITNGQVLRKDSISTRYNQPLRRDVSGLLGSK